MKIKKIGCVCAVAVCVAVIGIIAAALNPSLQTRIASSVLEGKFAGAKLQKLDAGISSISVDGLELPLPDGTKISLKSAKIKYSLSGLISKKVGIDSAAFAAALPNPLRRSLQALATKNLSPKLLWKARRKRKAGLCKPSRNGSLSSGIWRRI